MHMLLVFLVLLTGIINYRELRMEQITNLGEGTKTSPSLPYILFYAVLSQNDRQTMPSVIPNDWMKQVCSMRETADLTIWPQSIQSPFKVHLEKHGSILAMSLTSVKFLALLEQAERREGGNRQGNDKARALCVVKLRNKLTSPGKVPRPRITNAWFAVSVRLST